MAIEIGGYDPGSFTGGYVDSNISAYSYSGGTYTAPNGTKYQTSAGYSIVSSNQGFINVPSPDVANNLIGANNSRQQAQYAYLYANASRTGNWELLKAGLEKLGMGNLITPPKLATNSVTGAQVAPEQSGAIEFVYSSRSGNRDAIANQLTAVGIPYGLANSISNAKKLQIEFNTGTTRNNADYNALDKGYVSPGIARFVRNVELIEKTQSDTLNRQIPKVLNEIDEKYRNQIESMLKARQEGADRLARTAELSARNQRISAVRSERIASAEAATGAGNVGVTTVSNIPNSLGNVPSAASKTLGVNLGLADQLSPYITSAEPSFVNQNTPPTFRI